VWWHTPLTTALKRLRKEDHKFEASLSYTVRRAQEGEEREEKEEEEMVGEHFAYTSINI
jgi:guanylate kinase